MVHLRLHTPAGVMSAIHVVDNTLLTANSCSPDVFCHWNPVVDFNLFDRYFVCYFLYGLKLHLCTCNAI